MRRAILAALVGGLALAACSDRASKTPTEPKPGGVSANETSLCRRIPDWKRFPLQSVNAQIRALFPKGNDLRERALDRAEDIKEQWDDCRAIAAQTRVGNFVGFIIKKFQAGVLIGGRSPETADKVRELINTLYAGVGLAEPNLPIGSLGSEGEVAVGLFVPGAVFRLKTTNASLLIPANGFNVPTLITLIRLPDGSNTLTNGESVVPNQFPPFYDINASNASDHPHVLDNGYALVGFCAGDAVLPGAELFNPQIGHTRFNGVFEILAAAAAAEYASLGLNCIIQGNPSGISLERRGLPGLALRAWYAASVALLPEPLYATTVSHIGLGGRSTSFSAFGIVNAGD